MSTPQESWAIKQGTLMTRLLAIEFENVSANAKAIDELEHQLLSSEAIWLGEVPIF